MGFKKGLKQGIYIPVFPEKWVLTESSLDSGKIKYRSSWEKKFCVFADYNPQILKVSSESVIVPYYNPVKERMARYYIDFMIKTVDKVFLVEVKPRAECNPPKPGKYQTPKSEATYRRAIETYAVNQAKWEAAEKFATERGAQFIIITEDDLF